jgi:putative FmdB family regulatory protein
MPLYEYMCTHCGHSMEVLQKITDAALTLCPQCGAHALEKLVSRSGFRLKGEGWYETDFKDSASKRNLAGDWADKTPDDKKGTETKATPSEKPQKPEVPKKEAVSTETNLA